jgi:hypothetical protein
MLPVSMIMGMMDRNIKKAAAAANDVVLLSFRVLEKSLIMM